MLVTYDVSTLQDDSQKRLRRIAQACNGYGQRVQKSVFECSVSDVELEELINKLLKIMDKEQDSLRIYRLREPKDKFIRHYGVQTVVNLDEPLII
ncbi:CRISPR-associated protein, Cas2 family [Sporolituus thermophilus DSM 23256]|uniref:CRISPR-associated endoribonuclease Cas2 n=1 Tax=Sporolituus thermophilus DSM 23256 TaxID=1123285 RepID=A0A1G7PD17_9FIRM|nr:CRISPR-associated protein, Cas2 family [Sporolituus thermophilus DSM 23256]